jgi:hypothetical protein
MLVLENKILRKKFASMKDEINEELRILCK